MEKQLPKTKRSEISDKLEAILLSESDDFDLSDRTAVQQVAGELKRYKGLEFITSKKGQPEGKFAVWRVK
jgi:hypothetical protein